MTFETDTKIKCCVDQLRSPSISNQSFAVPRLVATGQQLTHALQQSRGSVEIAGQACSSPSNAFASFRSSVSKPSVNQP